MRLTLSVVEPQNLWQRTYGVALWANGTNFLTARRPRSCSVLRSPTHFFEPRGHTEKHRTHLLRDGELIDDLPVLHPRHRRSPEADGLAGGRDPLVVPPVHGGHGEPDQDMTVLGSQHQIRGRLQVAERSVKLMHLRVIPQAESP